MRSAGKSHRDQKASSAKKNRGHREHRVSFFEPLEGRTLMSATPLLTQLPTPQVASTIPGNGDVNPYGIAFVPDNFPSAGKLATGDTLVANFNNNQNAQGTGTTITLIDGAGNTSTFFQGSPGLGLDAGLSVLSSGYVLVGNVPATGNTTNPVGAGSILIIDKNGNQVGTVPGADINGPWDFTTLQQSNGNTVLFISNALSGSVERLTISPITQSGATLVSETQIASGYAHGPSAAAFVLGPAGVAYDSANGTLYVNGEGDDTVFAVPNALTTTSDNGTCSPIFQDTANLHGPLGLILASNGDLILANSDGVNADPNNPSELVEISTKGTLVATKFVDPNNGGAFNIAESFSDNMHRFAYVDDNTNQLTTWTLASTASSTAPLLPQLISPQSISTMPSNGDVNPYGIAFVPDNFPTDGKLQPGDILVSNFNNSQNAQGTGTTITQFHPAGNTTTFFQGSAGLGLDAGLAILSKGFVLVGNVPATGNTASPVGAGSILILDKNGNQVGQITGSFIQGPWDFTAVEQNGGKTVQLFVSNALSAPSIA